MTAGGPWRGAEPAVVGPYLAHALGDPRWATCHVAVISGGKSNLTYTVASPAGEVVLRRPPLAGVLPTAHDMVREHRVISALARTDVPVPRALHLCTDEAVLGVPFYVMSKVDGIVARTGLPAGYAERPAQRAAIGAALVDVLVRLHALDAAAVGLGDFGRPAGFLQRQVRRWVTQWDATEHAALPGLGRLAADLAASVPDSPTGTIVHGDYRLDNTVLDPARAGRVLAVLDWEMSTLGDPLTDLGLLLVYWSQADDDAVRQAARLPGATGLRGFPTRAEVVQRYEQASGRDVSAISWYVAFGCFKLAVVLAGVAARQAAGATLEGFGDVAGRVEPLVLVGRRSLDGAPL